VNVVFVGFYICRIPFTFSTDLQSDVISRFVDIKDIPWAIFVLTVQYLYLVLSIIVVNPRIPRQNIMAYIPEKIFKRILILSLIVIVLNIIKIIFVSSLFGQASSVFKITTTIFTVDNALMLILISSIMVRKSIFKKYIFVIVFGVLLFVFSYTYGGSKAGLLQVVLITFLALLVKHGPLVFRPQGLLVTAVLGSFVVFFYFVGKVFRNLRFLNKEFSLDNFLYAFDLFFIKQSTPSLLVNGFSNRVGYLDFFIQKISNPVYEPYINLIYYSKALIDKMTPGFDVFGVGFASRAIFGAYHGPSQSGVLNSELITVFGESYLLLGFFSFSLYLVILLLVKKLLLWFKTYTEAAYGLFYIYITFSFYWWLTGSGLDMWIALTIYQGIFVFFTIGLLRFWEKVARNQYFN